MQAIAEKMQLLAKSTGGVMETSSNTISSHSQSTRSSAIDSSFQRALSPQSLQSSISSGTSCRLSTVIRASQKDLHRPADHQADALEAELRLDFSDTDLRAFGAAMRSNIIRLAQEIKNVNKEQEQAIDGVGRLIENVAKAMNTAIQRSEERITNEIMSKLEQFQKSCRADLSIGPQAPVSADLVQAAKALAETDNKELYSMLSTCTSLLEAMQVRLAQLEASNFDKRMASLEASLRSRNEGASEQNDESTDNSIWAEALRSTLKRSANTPILSAEIGKRTSGTPVSSVPKSPSSESQVSNLFGGFSQQAQTSPSLPHGIHDGGAVNREQQQLQATQTEDGKHPTPSDKPRARELSPAQLWQNANAELSKAEGPLPSQLSLLSRAKQIGLNTPDEGGGLDTSQPRGRPSVPGTTAHKQPFGSVRTTSPNLPSSASKAPAFPARNRSADAPLSSVRPDGTCSPKPPAGPVINRNLGPCGPHQRHHDPSTPSSLSSSHRGHHALRAQSSQGVPHSGAMCLQASVRRTSASVMGQPLRHGS